MLRHKDKKSDTITRFVEKHLGNCIANFHLSTKVNNHHFYMVFGRFMWVMIDYSININRRLKCIWIFCIYQTKCFVILCILITKQIKAVWPPDMTKPRILTFKGRSLQAIIWVLPFPFPSLIFISKSREWRVSKRNFERNHQNIF